VSPTQLAEELVLFMTSSMKAAQSDIFELVDELGVTISQFKIMHLVESAGGEATTSKLAKLTGLSPAATSRAAEALARQGILERREDGTDRRVKWLALTARGREAIDRIMAARIQGLARLAEALDADQRAALSEALAPLIASTPDPENSP
jgi:DNA-binding MarR family transcriptional regulator